mmetsp:Transcript_1349/g.3812  ORF Transcript_1349/g.3812 Transcript_1349/m.3812 type:complete len:219 (+) Transcript_1349:692-1348(+)
MRLSPTSSYAHSSLSAWGRRTAAATGGSWRASPRRARRPPTSRREESTSATWSASTSARTRPSRPSPGAASTRSTVQCTMWTPCRRACLRKCLIAWCSTREIQRRWQGGVSATTQRARTASSHSMGPRRVCSMQTQQQTYYSSVSARSCFAWTSATSFSSVPVVVANAPGLPLCAVCASYVRSSADRCMALAMSMTTRQSPAARRPRLLDARSMEPRP